MRPETDGEFLRRKWLMGGLGLLIFGYGFIAILTGSSYDVIFSVFTENDEFFKVEGIVAVGSGVQYIGLGTLLVSYFFLPNSGLARHHVAAQRIGWVITAIGFSVFIISFLGQYDPPSQ